MTLKECSTKPLPLHAGERAFGCAPKAQFIICLTTSPQPAQKRITHSGCALHIASQKRLMVRCNFPLFPLIMWQAATPMSCVH